MSGKLLSLFIDVNDSFTPVVLSYGETKEEDSTEAPVVKSPNTVYARIEESNAALLYAAGLGTLSTNPAPRRDAASFEEGYFKALADIETTSFPENIDIYLHLSPLYSTNSDFRNSVRNLGGETSSMEGHIAQPRIAGFIYRNIDAASLKVEERLWDAFLHTQQFPRLPYVADDNEEDKVEAVWKLFCLGLIDIQVRSIGQAIGRPGTCSHDSTTYRCFEFGVIAYGGISLDPSQVYHQLADFVDEAHGKVADFLNVFPKRWPLIEGDRVACIGATESTLYNFSELQRIKREFNLTYDEWRTVGNNQKNLYIERLAARSPLQTGTVNYDNFPHFEFDDQDPENLFQLEAIVEFYYHNDDPWNSTRRLRVPATDNYAVNLIDYYGAGAGVNISISTGEIRVNLGNSVDSAAIRVDDPSDILELSEAPLIEDPLTENLLSKCYRIREVLSNTEVRIDFDSELYSSIDYYWRIRRRPTLILIDSFGPRVKGTEATIVSGHNNIINVESTADLSKVNGTTNTVGHFDTIYFKHDSARRSRTYRISSVNNTNKQITLDGNPTSDLSSSWDIPAGIGGNLPSLTYNLGLVAGTNYPNGYDHYDGVMLLVYQSAVSTSQYRWSSYTSRRNTGQNLSSIRGNRKYEFRSYRSGTVFKNYSLKIFDPGSTDDRVNSARFYFPGTVGDDSGNTGTQGKEEIRIHDGCNNMTSGYNGSAGCLVSPEHHDMRTRLIELYQFEHRSLNDWNPDQEVQKLAGLNRARAQQLWNNPTNAANGLSAQNWNDKIVGTLYLIRPDERPVG
jgi:hypothetical protein